MSTLAKAIDIAHTGFKYKTDKGGQPYILHCFRVMNYLHTDDDELKIIAILHDVVEDEVCTMNQLRKKGFSQRVCDAVELLTHRSIYSYDEYIKVISISPDARLVKLADLKDNTDITRLKGLTKKDFDRMEKYHKAFTYLSKC